MLNKKLTIGLFVDSFYPNVDGVVIVVDNLARTLTKLGHNVFVATTGNDDYYKNFPYKVICCKQIKRKNWYYGFGLCKLDKEFKNKLLNLKPDLIHIHSPFSLGKMGVIMANNLKIPILATLHSQFHQAFLKATHSKMITAVLIKRIIKVFQECDKVFVMSEQLQDMLYEYGYIGQTIILPNTTQMTYPSNPKELKNKINKLHNLKPSDVVFLFVGRLVTLKGIFFLLDVLLELKKRELKFTMFFVGTGPDEEKLKEQVKKFNLQNQVIFVGKVLDRKLLSAYYLRSKLFLFPSHFDTDSLVQKEAAVCKTATVFTTGTMTAHNIMDNVNGFLAPDNVLGFASKVVEVLQNETFLLKVEENAYQEVLGGVEKNIEKVLNCYEFEINKQNPLN